MAEYKRKRRSSFRAAPKFNKNRIKQNSQKTNEDIKMAPEEAPKPKKNMQVLRGKKLIRKRRIKIFSLVLGILVAVLLIFEWYLPAGLSETISNRLATIGSGSYPITLGSSKTFEAVSKGSYYYVLTDNNIEAYSSGGMQIFTYSHGFENPILKTSGTRALVFGQNANEAYIFTLSGLKETVKVKEKIVTAAIGDDGTYAIVTNVDNYSAKVSVYEKDNKLAYEWFSSKVHINNVAVAPSGESIAVSTIIGDVSKLDSKLLILDLDSSKPKHEKIYENTVVRNLDTSFKNGFSVLTANRYDYINWSDFETVTYTNEYTTDEFGIGNNGMAVVYNRESNKTDNRIAIFNDDGELEREIKFKGIITDLGFKDGHVYALSDSKVYILSDDGSIMRSADYGFGAVKICPISQSAAAVITDNTISEIKLEQE